MDKREMSAAELLEHLYRGMNTEPDVQAEMDAQDLLDLAKPDAPDQSEPAAAAAATPLPVADDAVPAVASAESRKAKARLALGFTVVLTGAIVAATLHENPVRDDSTSSLMKVALLDTDRADGSQVLASAEAGTVLFVNPFDDTEVFEFPAGTSESEARDTVAGFLLKRAMDRQASLR